MSTRRVPLSSNPNAANSPLRSAGLGGVNPLAAASFAKQRRSHASLQREENYGQPPPAKKQMLDSTATTARAVSLRSPTVKRTQQVQRGATSRAYQVERASTHHNHQQTQQEIQRISEKEAEVVRRWQQSQRQRFPKLVFYFDSLPEEHSSRLSKQVTYLGAREDKFFSIDITHVVTTRPIPPEEKPMTKQQQQQQQQHAKENTASHAPEIAQEHLQTINPSLLSRNNNDINLTTSLPVKRKLFDTAPGRRMPLAPFGAAEDAIRKPKPARSTDILQRAREMGKKIWSLEKLQRVLDMLLEPNPYRSAELGQRIRNGGSVSGASAHSNANSRFTGDQALLQMLDKERHNGPSDRDPTVATRELIYFKGPYIYVYDIEEKLRPTMVREYAKVADKEEGDWPQLRPSGGTRCPFIEDTDQLELRAEKRRARMRSAREAASTATAAAAGGSASLQKALASRHATAPRPVTGKRTIAEMEDGGHSRHSVTAAAAAAAAASSRHTESAVGSTAAATTAASTGSVSSTLSAIPGPSAISKASAADFQNAFTSRAKSARCLAGEPVASGLQAAGITSAIQSQMISSATGTLGARAGTSKEIHGLQRKVLQKSTAPTSQDLSSRRLAEMSMEQQNQQSQRSTYRSTSLGRSTAAAQLSARLNMAQEDGAPADDKHKRTMSAPVAVHPPRQKKRDPKPGYCENCQDKFDDFEDHILSHKHRKFAEDDRNWTELDDLISQLTRRPKYAFDELQ